MLCAQLDLSCFGTKPRDYVNYLETNEMKLNLLLMFLLGHSHKPHESF